MKIRFTRGRQEALLMKIGVPREIINQNCRKIPVK